MAIEVCTLGGFSDTGRNSTAIKVDDEVVILDMGLHLENYVRHTEDREDVSAKTYPELSKFNAVPNYDKIKDWKEKVIAIIPSHGHLDHMGAIPFAAALFPQAPVIATSYTIEILKATFSDEKINIPNKLITLETEKKYQLSGNITLELVHITHSIPDTAIIVLHTPYGKVVYANDYKLDMHPTLGSKPNLKRLEEIGKEGVSLLIIECLYAHEHKKCPSESIAKQMLDEVMAEADAKDKAVIVTTFSSHIARLKSIIEMGRKMNKEIIFLGRSLRKYVTAAEKIGIVDFQKEVKIISHQDKIDRVLRKVEKNRDRYLIVCTGHQGEPKAILSKIARGEFQFKFRKGDSVIFSCSIIPVELNEKNRDVLERQLKSEGVRIFRDIHVSGHAAREDHRHMLEILKPKEIIPSHSDKSKAINIASLAEEMGIKKKDIHLMEDGKRLRVS